MKIFIYFICILACYLTSALGALASISAKEFYTSLTTPSWAPPGWLFGPVWMTLYTLMGVSAARVWTKNGFTSSKLALTVFFLHLIPNSSWSWVFFYLQQGAVSVINIIALWVLIIYLVTTFYKIDKVSGFLQLPYLLWVTFASVLNITLWLSNPELL